MIYSLAVHTYRYFLFGETFESSDTSYLVKRLSLMRTVLSVILPVVRFFSEVPAGYNPVGRQGKDDFPT